MNIYTLESLATQAAFEYQESSHFDGIQRKVIEVQGGFEIAPPLPVFDDMPPVDNFMTGEPIPPEVRNKPKPPHNKILDDDVDYFELDLLKHIPDSHILKRLSLAVAGAIQMPNSSVFLTGLGVFSSIACRRYVAAYQHGGDVPIGLYVIAEQPSGTGKSWCLTSFQKPFFKSHDAKVKAYQKQLARLKSIPKDEQTDDEKQELKDLLEHAPHPLFSTNPTPEALEESLNQTGGFFAIISSEQGALNSMLGFAYKDKGASNNNDLLLNGFDGGHINSMRIKRGGYCGDVVGTLVSFAQNGSIEKMIKASDGTGLAERCLFAAEPHNLGKRDRTKSTAINRDLLEEYGAIASTLAELIHNQSSENLAVLNISDYGHKIIQGYLIEVEPHLVDGGKYSHSYLRGAASKLNIQIMKIAANLHLSSSTDSFHNNQIPDNYIESAIEIVHAIFEASVQICTKKGFIGERAELESLIAYLSKDGGKPKIATEITNSLRFTQPFKNYSGSQRKAARKALEDAVLQGFVVEIVVTGKPTSYKLA